MSARNERGFTAAEILIAAVIVTVAFVALARIVPLAGYAVQEGNQLSTATFLADQRLEQIRGVPWTSVPANDCLGVSVASTAAPTVPAGATCTLGSTTVNAGGALTWEADEAATTISGFSGYSRSVRVTDCGGGSGCAGIADSGMRLVTVTVTYISVNAGTSVAAVPKSSQVQMIVSQQ
jgi:Tfp pilus assembly protein PilV